MPIVASRERGPAFSKSWQRWLPISLLVLACVLCLLRFAFMLANFPNHSPWVLDQAKYTDEGWWASGAVRHTLLRHWEVSGDYNPAVVAPVWPLLLALVFHFTGVSLTAVRTVNVMFSVATVALIYPLVRRYQGSCTAAALAALLLAASPFAFAFSRLATLDTVVVFEWVLALWLASYAGRQRFWSVTLAGGVMAIMILTKTTSLVLLPAVLWVLSKKSLRALLTASMVAGALAGGYYLIVLQSRYADDYHFFFYINALADVDLKNTVLWLRQLLEHGLWIDRILYPVGLTTLFVSVFWLRGLWRNPLFTAAWIALAGNAIYILRRQDDYAPRYFLAMLVPLILAIVFTWNELKTRPLAAFFLSAAITLAVVLDMIQVGAFLTHRQYQWIDAAKAIQAKVNADPKTPRLLLGASADQLSLMTGIPAINDQYTSEDLGQKVLSQQPGWYVGWNDLDQDVVESLSAFRLDQVASFLVFDRPDRDQLNLYRMVPLKEKHK